MKKFILNGTMKFIENNKKCSNEQLEVIKYGLEGLYLTISKLIIIFIIAFFLNISKETFIFLLIYNLIRLFSFGLHATKSWICLVSSIIIFIGFPIICLKINLNLILKLFLSILLIILIYNNSPADTKKRPIINKTRRKYLKYISTFIAILFSILSFKIKNKFLSNCFIGSLIVQSFMISPLTYKLFHLPYNNYLNYKNDI